MPTVNERDLDSEYYLCVQCDSFEGAIWLCGEGLLCEKCFSEAADIPEEEAFGEVSEESRSKAKAKFNKDREHAS